MAKFEEGETVQLNSGGPIMTAGEIHEGEVVCQWFDSKNELKHATFKETLLRKAKPESIPEFNLGTM